MTAEVQKASWRRWLSWTPRERILADSPEGEPTKPTKLPVVEQPAYSEMPEGTESGGFEGFVGTEEASIQKIQGQSVSHGLSRESAAGSDGGDSDSEVESNSEARIIRKVPGSEPSKPTKPPDLERGKLALAFVNRAAARIVCPDCYPGCPAGAKFVIIVPAVNDTPEFQAALKALGLEHLPVVHRDAPLGFRPEVEHGLARGRP